jgi:hypothetical protein
MAVRLSLFVIFKIRSPSESDIGSSRQDFSKRDLNGYIRFWIILPYIAILGTKFAHNVPNSTTVCYWFTLIFI